jgi:hypothetical protein
MNKRLVLASALAWAALGAGPALAQLAPDELAERPKWESFLLTAEIAGSEQMRGDKAVTSPWRLTLKGGDGAVRDALWKNPEGMIGGFLEGWKYEIAAYLLDKGLGLGMVPPTVERRFHGDRGSLQLWIPDCLTLREKTEQKIKMPMIKVFNWNRATYLQRAWDNLIANEDRHLNQILVTPDFRMILIDHSRSFRTGKKFVKALIYTEKHREGPKLMSELPRAFVEKLKSLTSDAIKTIVGDYLKDQEIEAVMARRDLILAEIDRLVAKGGEANVLY